MSCCHTDESECELRLVNGLEQELEVSVAAIIEAASLASGQDNAAIAQVGDGRHVTLKQYPSGFWRVSTESEHGIDFGYGDRIEAFMEFLSRIEDMGYYLDVDDIPEK